MLIANRAAAVRMRAGQLTTVWPICSFVRGSICAQRSCSSGSSAQSSTRPDSESLPSVSFYSVTVLRRTPANAALDLQCKGLHIYMVNVSPEWLIWLKGTPCNISPTMIEQHESPYFIAEMFNSWKILGEKNEQTVMKFVAKSTRFDLQFHQSGKVSMETSTKGGKMNEI